MIKPEKILIIRTDRIGDVVLSLPMIDILKKHYPESKITFALRQYTSELLEGNTHLEEIIILNEENGKIPFFSNLKRLKAKQFDTAILVSPTFKKALLLFLCGIKNRIGTGYRWYSFLFNYKKYEHRKYGDKHELQLNLNMLSLLGINEEINTNSVHFNIHIKESTKQKIKEVLKSENIDTGKSSIIVHPGSGGSAIDLPPEKMKTLVGLLAQGLDCNILITGSEKEKILCENMLTDQNTYNLAGKFNLTEFIALVDECELMVANSTGPIHIAAALNKYVVGFYPKIPSCSQERWGPFTTKRSLFLPELNCSNCTRKQCENLNCMNSIDINNVFNTIKNVLIKESGLK